MKMRTTFVMTTLACLTVVHPLAAKVEDNIATEDIKSFRNVEVPKK